MTENQVSASDHFHQGVAKHHLGQYSTAINEFNAAIRLKPNFAEAYSNRGVVKAELDRYDAAIADYDNAIQLEPDFAEAYHNRGLAKYNLGRYDAAIIDFDNAIRLKPDYAVAYYNLGNAMAKLGHTLQAERSWRTALNLATQTDNVTLRNEIISILRRSTDQVKTFNSTTEQQITFYQEPLPQNNEKVNQQAKKLLEQIPEDELEYPIDPE